MREELKDGLMVSQTELIDEKNMDKIKILHSFYGLFRMILKCESVFLSILVTKIDVISCIVKLANYTVKLAKVILKFAHVF